MNKTQIEEFVEMYGSQANFDHFTTYMNNFGIGKSIRDIRDQWKEYVRWRNNRIESLIKQTKSIINE